MKNGTTYKALFAVLASTLAASLLISSLALSKASAAEAGYYGNKVAIGRIEERLDAIDRRLAEIAGDVRELVRREK